MRVSLTQAFSIAMLFAGCLFPSTSLAQLMEREILPDNSWVSSHVDDSENEFEGSEVSVGPNFIAASKTRAEFLGDKIGAVEIYDAHTNQHVRTIWNPDRLYRGAFFGIETSMVGDILFVLGTATAEGNSSSTVHLYIFDLSRASNQPVITRDLEISPSIDSSIAFGVDKFVIGEEGSIKIYNSIDFLSSNGLPAPAITIDNGVNDGLGEQVAVDGNYVATTINGNTIVYEVDTDLGTYSIISVTGSGGGSSLELSGFRLFQGFRNDRVDAYDIRTGFATLLWSVDAPTDILNESGNFGSSLSVEGSTLVVGAWRGNTQGVSDTGAVYVYTFNQLGATFDARLQTDTEIGGDNLGQAVAIGRDFIAVGAPASNNGEGSVLIFDKRDGSPELMWTIENPFPDFNGADFGAILAMDGNRLAISATRGLDSDGLAHVYSLSNNGPNRLESLFTLGDSGGSKIRSLDLDGDLLIAGHYDGAANGVDVFNLNASVPTHIFDPAPGTNSSFGWDVAIDDGTIVVGSFGRAYVFEVDPYTFCPDPYDPSFCVTGFVSPVTTILDPDPATGWFGRSVDIDGDTIVVGSPLLFEHETDIGQVHVFDIASDVAVETHTIDGPDNPADTFGFGSTVAISDQRIVIAALVNADQQEGLIAEGRVFEYQNIDGDMVLTSTMIPAEHRTEVDREGNQGSASFGKSIAVNGEQIVVGAPFDNHQAPRAGSAYFYEIGSCMLGDINLGGTVNFFDISPFISILAVGGFQCEADCNEDGVVDFFDIQPFVEVLSRQ